jgi:hypothetical protein
MRIDQLDSVRPAVPLSPSGGAAGMSRRHFLQRAAVATALGAAATAGLANRRDVDAASPGIGLVVPIPYGLDFFGDGRLFHVEAPPFAVAGDDPSTVYNLRGTSGIAFIDGLVDRTNRKTGVVETLPFIASDMRFMQGDFRGRDGKMRSGTFGFI